MMTIFLMPMLLAAIAALSLYDAFVQVSIAAYLRDIRTFPDASALQLQIQQDIAQARQVIAGFAPLPSSSSFWTHHG